MAARAMASATITFGLVSIPVKLYTTAESSESISFRLLHSKCHTPLKRPYWCPKDEVMVERDEIVKGYEYTKDQYVLFTDEEIKAVEEEVTKAIEIEEFVPLDRIGPVFFDKAYYLGPDKGGSRPYRLLAKAMAHKGLGGLASYRARGKQYLVLVRPYEDGLLMQQLRYADEVRPFTEVPVDDKAKVKEEELKLALKLIGQTAKQKFEPKKYEDAVKARMMEAIEQKVAGEEITFAAEAAPQAKVIDLMEALKASLAGGTAGAKPARAKAATAKERKPAKASPRTKAAKAKTARKKASR